MLGRPAGAKAKKNQMASLRWAENLVGRDWEIWWCESEEGTSDDKNGSSPSDPSEMDVDKDLSTMENDVLVTGGDLVSDIVMASLDEMNDDPVEPEVENEASEGGNEGSESNDDASVIDDWYAGRILSLEDTGESIIFKIVFVGDEQIYEMALDPTKVRPSAIAWIVSVKSAKFAPCTAFVSHVVSRNGQRQFFALPTSHLIRSFHLTLILILTPLC